MTKTLNPDYWPTQEWRTTAPECVGMDAALLSNLDREIEVRFRSISAFLIVKDGSLVLERYYGKVGLEDKHLVASVTKSFISALIGIVIGHGFIEGVEQRVLDFFPEYTPGSGDGLKRQMTIEHLLTMTAGIRWHSGPRANELLLNRMRRSKDWVNFILDLPVQERLFGTYQYNSAASHLLSAIITRSTGQCAQEYAAEHLFEAIGMDPPPSTILQNYSQEKVFRTKDGGWPKDPQGNNIGGWGLMLKPRDMARFGYLYLRQGQWDGEQVIPERWVVASITPHTAGYGYQWWLRDVNDVFVYSAVGQGGQHIFCVPQKDIVVVVTSKMGARWRDRWPLLEEYVIPAVVQ